MTFAEKYDKVISGLISGLIFPVVVGIVIFLFFSDNMPLGTYLSRLAESNIITHSIS